MARSGDLVATVENDVIEISEVTHGIVFARLQYTIHVVNAGLTTWKQEIKTQQIKFKKLSGTFIVAGGDHVSTVFVDVPSASEDIPLREIIS